MTDRRTGSVGADVDLQRTGITTDRQTGALGADIDLRRLGIITNRQTGMVGVIVDGIYVAGVAGGIQWGAGAFQPVGGAYAPVFWSPSAFALSAGQAVNWNTSNDQFELMG
jgi:hypothetical protein